MCKQRNVLNSSQKDEANHSPWSLCKSRLDNYKVFNKIPHATFPLAFLLHSTQGRKSAHLISSHSIFCFLLVTQHVALGFLYGALFRPRWGGKIHHFLMTSASLHIATASKYFESINKHATPLKILYYSCFTERQLTQGDVTFWKGQNRTFRMHSLLTSV